VFFNNYWLGEASPRVTNSVALYKAM
jgi:hypothetical protein